MRYRWWSLRTGCILAFVDIQDDHLSTHLVQSPHKQRADSGCSCKDVLDKVGILRIRDVG